MFANHHGFSRVAAERVDAGTRDPKKRGTAEIRVRSARIRVPAFACCHLGMAHAVLGIDTATRLPLLRAKRIRRIQPRRTGRR